MTHGIKLCGSSENKYFRQKIEKNKAEKCSKTYKIMSYLAACTMRVTVPSFRSKIMGVFQFLVLW